MKDRIKRDYFKRELKQNRLKDLKKGFGFRFKKRKNSRLKRELEPFREDIDSISYSFNFQKRKRGYRRGRD